jgi:mRNA interferase RelE/StbE
MNIEFTRRFRKEFRQIEKDRSIAILLNEVIENVIRAKSPAEIKNLKKLTGFKVHYRIRIGSYRIGVKIEKDTIIFAAFDHRKDIYKKFP